MRCEEGQSPASIVAIATAGQCEAEYDLAVKVLKRTQQLFQQKAVEQNQLDKDSSWEQTAKAAVVGTRANVASAQAAITSAEAKIEKV